ncbi:hypothetical protein TC41_2489 [Alicyclobacillus acidocaldarius subsp. acidocaldarius Tc-4-1]|uniref:Uncharacterized protein n=1 Tax=Alicyclobacillus acidocaldarius (strain Tc-4-1) TaxID=1048834 RepID=F8IH34_ALIAT|nr:hypothetical protein TC41_2489 [Alicyclobacillus acidocaldarius subsp. acidocaldarius Tc-4-1]
MVIMLDRIARRRSPAWETSEVYRAYQEALFEAVERCRAAEVAYEWADDPAEPLAFANLQKARAEVSTILREAREAWRNGNDVERVSH